MNEDIYIKLGVTLMLEMLKDAKRAKKFQRVMLKVFGAIAQTYRTEQEFHELAEKELNQ